MFNRSAANRFVLEPDKVLINTLVLLFIVLLSTPVYPQPQTPSYLNNAQLEIQRQVTTPPSWAINSFNWPVLKSIYKTNQFNPIWVNGREFHLDTIGFIALLEASSLHGLSPKNYHLYSITQQIPTTQMEERIWLDLLLTDAFLSYVSDISSGRFDPTTSDPEWYIQRPSVDAEKLLLSIIEQGDLVTTLSRLAPSTKQYEDLIIALQTYDNIRISGGLKFLPSGPALKFDVWHPNVVLLRKRLRQEGETLSSIVMDESYFDKELEQAVMNFQRRHGLEVDGSVGPKTRAVANFTIEHRIAQIKLNLERQRWLPRDRGGLHVEVNLADFRLDVFEEGSSILRMPIIIGKRFHATPAFNNKISYMVVNPEWNIPRRIAKEEIIPAQVNNADTFNRLNIKVLTGWGRDAAEIQVQDIDWQQWLGKASPYRLVQRAGDSNSLGRIKFMFHNRFNVYMHDTPHRHLFDRRVRMFSHGCIRVGRPIELANVLLNKVSTTDLGFIEPNFIENEISSGNTKIIRLSQPVPVYLIYKTAWVDEQGQVNFRHDVYDRDSLLMASVAVNTAGF